MLKLEGARSTVEDVGGEENKTEIFQEESNETGSDPSTKSVATYDDTPANTDVISDEKEFLEEEVKFDSNGNQTETQSGHSRALAASMMSYYEEEIIEDDDLIEEEVIDDDGDDDEFEEEIVEEFVDENDLPRAEDEQKYNDDDPNRYEQADASAVEKQNTPVYQFTPEDRTRQTGKNIRVANAADADDANNNIPIKQLRQEISEADVNSPLYAVHGGLAATVDAENQQQQLRGEKPPSNKLLMKREPSPSSCWYWILCIILFGLIGAGAGFGYWLTTRDGYKISTILPPTRTRPPTAAPSTGVSSYFDNVQGGECNFDGVANPNPIDQCLCFGEIVMIEPDVRERYQYNLENFIPTHFENYEDDISSCSPRNQALVWISSGDDAELTTAQRTQRYALATIFASLSGTQWYRNTNWLTYGSSCTWFGITCIEDFVTELVLDGNNLVGMLPSEVSLLVRLRTFMVARNQIGGTIPVSLFTVQALVTVDVSFNSMTGVIPPTVGDALSLNSLNVKNNSLSGRLTKRIGEAKNLGYLDLKSNKFVSELPMELFNLKQMIELNIGDNQFEGTISQEISKLNVLNRLTLGPNLFIGTIPSTISSLSSLTYLSARGIKGLSGRIPAEFGFRLTNLKEIVISDTNIEGNIDTSFGMLPNLETLEFSKNQLRSVIPSELGNLKSLVTLNLEQNFLDGQIPDTIGNISSLQQLRLNNNLLEGGIPISFSNLRFLETIQLEVNRLEDRVEDGICNLRKERLVVFEVDCPIEIESATGIEIFGVVCQVPECCTKCVLQ